MSFSAETERLILRPFEVKDVENLYILDSNPLVHQYLGNKPAQTIQETENTIQSVLQQYDEYGIGRVIVLEKSSGEFVGWAGLKYEFNSGYSDGPVYDVGYRLRPEYWGKGYATESGLKSIEYGFKQLSLSTIHAGVHHENQASQKVLEKLGLTKMGEFSYESIPCYWYQINQKL